MKIAHVSPGLIEIPPKGWGAIEKLIANYCRYLPKLGHTVDVVSIDGFDPLAYDIVHVYIANQALILANKGVRYVFTMNDHHVCVYGKSSPCFSENLEAIKRSVVSTVSGEFLLEYFGHPRNLVYLPNNVDTNVYRPISVKEYGDFLCVGNNGTGANPDHDRKGFEFAFSLAKQLGRKIKIAGPARNEEWIHRKGLRYDGLSFVGDPNEDQLVDLYNYHRIFLHFSDLEAGHPNLTLLEASACGRPIIGTYQGSIPLTGMIICERNLEKAKEAVKKIEDDYATYCTNSWETGQRFSAYTNSIELDSIYRDVVSNHYKPSLYLLNSPKVFERKLDYLYTDRPVVSPFKDRRVYIHLDSKALGDTLAWIPYAERFAQEHSCKVICSTFWNKLFTEQYPELEFVEPGTPVNNIAKMLTVGCFDDKKNWRKKSLQKVATDILGLKFEEIRPRVLKDALKYASPPSPMRRYVAIATESTLQAKYWNLPIGWQQLAQRLNSKGFRVINVSLNAPRIEGVINYENTKIEEAISLIQHSDFFIGLGSGLSWLAWALEKQVVLISGFSKPWAEFSECIRVHNDSVCNGCYNDESVEFDRGDWNWCPHHKGTSRQYECSRSITVEDVWSAVQHLTN